MVILIKVNVEFAFKTVVESSLTYVMHFRANSLRWSLMDFENLMDYFACLILIFRLTIRLCD